MSCNKGDVPQGDTLYEKQYSNLLNSNELKNSRVVLGGTSPRRPQGNRVISGNIPEAMTLKRKSKEVLKWQ